MLNILHLSETPLSGAPYRLMKVQRLGGHNARLINHRVRYNGRTNMVYPHDILLQRDCDCCTDGVFNREEIYSLFDSADILHFHNNVHDVFLLKLYPQLRKYLKSKHVVFQVHSPRESLKYVEKDINNKDVNTRLVIAQFQARQYKDFTVVPNAIDITDPLYSPKDYENEVPHIVYSPSNTNLKGWNDKGFRDVMRVLERLPKDKCTYDVITNTPHLKCIERKKKGDIAIDELVTGSYHLCTLEGLSHGQAVFCSVDSLTVKALMKVAPAAFPVISSSPRTMQTDIETLIERPDLIRHYRAITRKFMEDYWSPQQINEHYIKAYQ